MKLAKPDTQTTVLIGSVIWGMYWLTHWRTQSFGFSLPGTFGLILLASLSVLPITILGVLGLPWHKALLRFSVALIAMIGFAEAFAGIQEVLVVKEFGENPNEWTIIARWPPFGDHQITYSPGYGWIGGD